jgi:hypothetical protein
MAHYINTEEVRRLQALYAARDEAKPGAAEALANYIVQLESTRGRSSVEPATDIATAEQEAKLSEQVEGQATKEDEESDKGEEGEEEGDNNGDEPQETVEMHPTVSQQQQHTVSQHTPSQQQQHPTVSQQQQHTVSQQQQRCCSNKKCSKQLPPDYAKKQCQRCNSYDSARKRAQRAGKSTATATDSGEFQSAPRGPAAGLQTTASGALAAKSSSMFDRQTTQFDRQQTSAAVSLVHDVHDSMQRDIERREVTTRNLAEQTERIEVTENTKERASHSVHIEYAAQVCAVVEQFKTERIIQMHEATLECTRSLHHVMSVVPRALAETMPQQMRSMIADTVESALASATQATRNEAERMKRQRTNQYSQAAEMRRDADATLLAAGLSNSVAKSRGKKRPWQMPAMRTFTREFADVDGDAALDAGERAWQSAVGTGGGGGDSDDDELHATRANGALALDRGSRGIEIYERCGVNLASSLIGRMNAEVLKCYTLAGKSQESMYDALPVSLDLKRLRAAPAKATPSAALARAAPAQATPSAALARAPPTSYGVNAKQDGEKEGGRGKDGGKEDQSDDDDVVDDVDDVVDEEVPEEVWDDNLALAFVASCRKRAYMRQTFALRTPFRVPAAVLLPVGWYRKDDGYATTTTTTSSAGDGQTDRGGSNEPLTLDISPLDIVVVLCDQPHDVAFDADLRAASAFADSTDMQAQQAGRIEKAKCIMEQAQQAVRIEEAQQAKRIKKAQRIAAENEPPAARANTVVERAGRVFRAEQRYDGSLSGTREPFASRRLPYHDILEARGIDRLYHVPLLAFKGIEEWFFPRDYPTLLQAFLYEDAAMRAAPRAAVPTHTFYATPRCYMRQVSSALKPWPLRFRSSNEYEYSWPSLEYDTNVMCCERIARAADDETNRVCTALYGERFDDHFAAMTNQHYAPDKNKGGEEKRPFERYFQPMRVARHAEWEQLCREREQERSRKTTPAANKQTTTTEVKQ